MLINIQTSQFHWRPAVGVSEKKLKGGSNEVKPTGAVVVVRITILIAHDLCIYVRHTDKMPPDIASVAQNALSELEKH